MNRILIPLLAAAALAAAGCGGTTGNSAATATATVSTEPASTTASASFDVNFKRVQQELTDGLKAVERGDAVDAIAGGGTVLTNCSDTVTSQLGARAKTTKQKQAVSQLRTACADAAEAFTKLKNGENDAAERLAKTAAQEVADANTSSQ